MNEVSSIIEKQANKSMQKIKVLLDEVLDECERAALIYEMSPDAAGDLMKMISDELEGFSHSFYDTIVTKCIDQVRINYSQGKLFDD